jgi:hypothetical protein
VLLPFQEGALLAHVMPDGEHYEAIAGSQIDDLECTPAPRSRAVSRGGA